ncbi:MAG TPA: hypothetical protein VLA52_17400 [Thermohalobaculum sp.]|nr:hypothetical protein [Thermohalobaculum sp.]
MRATIERWGRVLLTLSAFVMLSACAVGREPAYDAVLAGELTELTAETLRLFQELQPNSGVTHDDRAPRYRDLSSRAETVRLMAQARGSAAAPGPLVMRLADLGANLSLAEGIPADVTARMAEYADATPAYMEDFLRNLGALEALDRAGTGNRAERQAAYEAALAAHDAEVEAYIGAFRQWQAIGGKRPEQPGAAPQIPALGLDHAQLALRRTALEDILRDALVYERDILNRNR